MADSEGRAVAQRWRKPHTCPTDGTPFIAAYRWLDDSPLHVTLGTWFAAGEKSGVIEHPDGCYIPCVGWLPLPNGEHPAFEPLHLRRPSPIHARGGR